MLRLRLLCFALLFSIAVTSNAQFGSEEQAILAAKENREPAYIEEMMFELRETLNEFVKENNIEPSADFHWRYLMQDFVNAVFLSALRGAEHASGSNHAQVVALKSALFDAFTAAGPSEEIQFGAFDGLWPIGTSPEETARIAFRVTEWRALKLGLSKLKRFSENNFVSLERRYGLNAKVYDVDGQTLYRDKFSKLSREAMLYLAPWLTLVVPFDALSREHQEWFLKLYLPKEDKPVPVLKLLSECVHSVMFEGGSACISGVL